MELSGGGKKTCMPDRSDKSVTMSCKKIKTVSNAKEVQLCPDYNP